MSKVFVLDTNKRPLNPVHPGKAKILLDTGKAAIFKRLPFTLILKRAVDNPVVAELRVKIDPGSKTIGSPVECGSGSLAKYNRARRGLPKTHWLDATCVGTSTPEYIGTCGVTPLAIMAFEHGRRQVCLMDKYGFPRTLPKKKGAHGFCTGDMVKAVVPSYLKNAGTYLGRMSAKASGSFTIATGSSTVTDISSRYCRKLQRADGYGYFRLSAAFFLPRKDFYGTGQY